MAPISGATTLIRTTVFLIRLLLMALCLMELVETVIVDRGFVSSHLRAGPRCVPGIPDRLLELLPGAGVALFPTRAGRLRDRRPIGVAVARIGAQVVAIT